MLAVVLVLVVVVVAVVDVVARRGVSFGFCCLCWHVVSIHLVARRIFIQG